MYLVTGGAGFIGSHIVKRLLQEGERVKVVDNLSTGKLSNIENILSKIEFLEGDLCEIEVARKAVEDIEIILHQAAIPSVIKAKQQPLLVHHANLTATLNLLQAAVRKKNIKKFIFASSSSVYGEGNKPKKEDDNLFPLSFYGATKVAAEKYCLTYHNCWGLRVIILRYFNIFGEFQDFNSEYSAVIPKFIKLALEGKKLPIYGDGLQSRDFTYISNLIDVIMLCIEAPLNCDVINVGCGKSYSILELVDILRKELNKDIEIEFLPSRLEDIRHSLACIDKLKNLLNYQPKVSLEGGIKRMIKWLKANM